MRPGYASGINRAAVALNDATTTSPSRSPSRSADPLVISPASGPTRTRTRLPDRDERVDRRRDVVHGRVVGCRPRDSDLPRDGRRPRRGPTPASVVQAAPPTSSTTRVRPPPPGSATPWSNDGPGEAGDERVGGRSDQLRRRADLEQPPVDDHADAVGERRRILEVVRDEDRRQPKRGEQVAQLARARRRGCARRARRAARRAGARAAPARSPAPARRAGARRRTACRAARPARSAIRSRSRTSSTSPALVAPNATFARTERCGKERVLLEHEPHRAALRRHVDAGRGIEPGVSVDVDASRARAAAARRSARRTLDLPAPDGPDEGDRLRPDLERQLEADVAETVGKSDVERRHEGTSLTARRTAALTTTSSAPIARAVSKSTSNCS